VDWEASTASFEVMLAERKKQRDKAHDAAQSAEALERPRVSG
jgi:hypothetical protein